MNDPKDLPAIEYTTTLSNGHRVKLLVSSTTRGYVSKRHRKRMSYRRRGERCRGRTISRHRWGSERGSMHATNGKSFQSIGEAVQMSFCNIESAVDVGWPFLVNK